MGELAQTIDLESRCDLSQFVTPYGGTILALSDVIAQIDAEIAKLQQAKVLLSGAEAPKSGRGRPKGSKNTKTTAAVAAPVASKSKRKLTPEGRKAIAEAMKRRWAERRKQPGK